MNLDTNRFFNNIESRFDELKTKTIKYAKKCNIDFDEDIFMDTILHCAEVCPDECYDNASIDNYFWVSYKQNVLTSKHRNKFKDSIDIDEPGVDVIDVIYNEDIDYIVDIIKDDIESKFGRVICEAWLLTVCEGWSINELESVGYRIPNIVKTFEKVDAYVKNLSKTDSELKRLLYENNFI
jgi:hypothetical protein